MSARRLKTWPSRAGLAVGTFYQHFRSKRQLLLVLMDDLLEGLSNIDLQPGAMSRCPGRYSRTVDYAFSQDLHYLGAYRAWQEAMLSDADLAAWQRKIQHWTTARVEALFRFLEELPGARRGSRLHGLARAMDSFFWDLLSQAKQLSKAQLQSAHSKLPLI